MIRLARASFGIFALVGVIYDDRQQFLDPCASLRGDNAKLSQVGSYGIDQLRALAHQKIAGAMSHSKSQCYSITSSASAIMRYELTDHEWAVIKPMLPNKPRG